MHFKGNFTFAKLLPFKNAIVNKKKNSTRYKHKKTQLSAVFCVLLQVQVNSNKQSSADFGNQRRRSIILAPGSVVKQHSAQIYSYSPIYSVITHYFLLLKLIHLGYQHEGYCNSVPRGNEPIGLAA